MPFYLYVITKTSMYIQSQQNLYCDCSVKMIERDKYQSQYKLCWLWIYLFVALFLLSLKLHIRIKAESGFEQTTVLKYIGFLQFLVNVNLYSLPPGQLQCARGLVQRLGECFSRVFSVIRKTHLLGSYSPRRDTRFFYKHKCFLG